jgi:DNA-binding transcriptional ArsR family regulator
MTVREGLRFVTDDGVNSEGWGVLAEPSRRAICMQLAERPRAVGELAEDLPISRPAVSQHLRVLKTAGLVTDEVVGTRRVYRLDRLAVAALRDQLDTFWNRALAGYQDTVTNQSPSGSTTTEEDP